VLLIKPDYWKFNVQNPPYAFISGKTAVFLVNGDSVGALRKGGVPLTTLSAKDWCRFMLLNPSPYGPTFPHPNELHELAGF
jgi:hypothetical protein